MIPNNKHSFITKQKFLNDRSFTEYNIRQVVHANDITSNKTVTASNYHEFPENSQNQINKRPSTNSNKHIKLREKNVDDTWTRGGECIRLNNNRFKKDFDIPNRNINYEDD